MQIKKRNRKSSRKASRGHSRKAHSRKACRSARRRMGGMGGEEDTPTRPMMTIHQSPEADFEIMFNPEAELKYAAILNHPENHFRARMAPTFAAQGNGEGDYMLHFRGLDADIVQRPSVIFENRLNAVKALSY